VKIRRLLWFCCFAILTAALSHHAAAGEQDGRLDIYFIDVEGGAATLVVTPVGESILIDSGYPDNSGRDLKRILHVIREVAGLDRLDHAAVTHWHRDHYGNHAALAAEIEIGTFWDRGIPDALEEDPEFPARIAQYRAATQNESKTLKAGDRFELDSNETPLAVHVVTASREVIPNAGQPNPFASLHEPKPEDPSDNAASLSFLMSYGPFRFLCCGDLTWNVEAKLVTPNNSLGQVDLFMVTHHGLPVSNNPALVLAIDPVTAVMCNGPTKGGHPGAIATLRKVKSLQGLYQLHRNIQLSAEEQAPADYIANSEPTVNCSGVWVKASVAPGGRSYTLQIGPDGQRRTYQTRTTAQ
jgi:beta-lactamase superfamily II metal-dependent hydrolase